jgi:hypothetical protein
MKKQNVFLVLLTGFALTLGLTACPSPTDQDIVQEKVATPAANPPAGEVPAGTSITLESETGGATIYYTLDGTAPSRASNLYTDESKPVVANDCTLKAFGIKDGMIDSDVFEAEYTVNALTKVATPAANPAAGAVNAGTEIALVCDTGGAAIYYTLDGATPTTGSTRYDENSKPVITVACTIKAIAVKDGMDNSDVLEAEYTVNALTKVATPTANPAAGAVNAGTEIALVCGTGGAVIYYTLDGAAPTTGSTRYDENSKPVITVACTITAIAIKDGMDNSDVLEAEYTVNVPEPVELAFDFKASGSGEGQSKLTFGSASLLARKVAYGNGVWVVVADSGVSQTNPGQIVYSEDNGMTWNAATTNPSSTHIFNVIFGGDKFVAVGRQGGIFYSTDGKDWTQATKASGSNFSNIYGLAYSGSRFVLTTAEGRIGYSDNGTSGWTQVTAGTDDTQSQFASNQQIQGAAYGNGKFVVGGTAGRMAYSDNGVTWTAIEEGTEEDQSQISGDTSVVIVNIAYGGPVGEEKFVAVSTKGQMAWSEDGIVWNKITPSTFDINTDRSFRFVTWGGGRFLAGGGPVSTTPAGGFMVESFDGVTWTRVTLPTNSTKAFYGAAYGGGKFIAVDSQGIFAISNLLE